MNCRDVDYVNVRDWSTGKLDDMSKELDEWRFDLVDVVDDHLRENVQVEGKMYEMRRLHVEEA